MLALSVSGVLREDIEDDTEVEVDPNAMMGMMKNNLSFVIPQVVMMAWVSYFFAGFVAVRLPFTLTPQFKMMMQRGIEITSLDVSCVSSLSWYFLAVFGLRGLVTLIVGAGRAIDDTKMMQAQMSMGAPMPGMPGMPGAGNANKVLQTECENLSLVQHRDLLAGIENRFLGVTPVSSSTEASKPSASGSRAPSSSRPASLPSNVRQRRSRRG
jgi:ER membrane protein complex subunit 3